MSLNIHENRTFSVCFFHDLVLRYLNSEFVLSCQEVYRIPKKSQVEKEGNGKLSPTLIVMCEFFFFCAHIVIIISSRRSQSRPRHSLDATRYVWKPRA